MAKLNLIIDTSIHGAAVGLLTSGVNPGQLIFSEVSNEVMDSARQLPLMVARGLQHVGATVGDVSRLIVSQGPGSFTGIRVGLAYAYGLFLGFESESSHETGIAGVSSLAELAKHISVSHAVDLALFLPATKTGGYAAFCEGGKARLIAVDTMKPETIEGAPKMWVIIGSWEALGLLALQKNAIIKETIEPKLAAQMALAAIAGVVNSGSIVGHSTEMPNAIYLRKSTVEEKAAEGQQKSIDSKSSS